MPKYPAELELEETMSDQPFERPADEDEITEPERYVGVEPDGKVSDSRAYERGDDD